jgi:large subunit ribosomal protein L33
MPLDADYDVDQAFEAVAEPVAPQASFTAGWIAAPVLAVLGLAVWFRRAVQKAQYNEIADVEFGGEEWAMAGVSGEEPPAATSPVPSFMGGSFISRMLGRMNPFETSLFAKKKGIRLIVTLECTEARPEGKTPSRYTTQKNKKNTSARLELMKYNKYLRRHTLHREIK